MPYLNDPNIMCTYDPVTKTVVPIYGASGTLPTSSVPTPISTLAANQLFIEKLTYVQSSDITGGTGNYVTGSNGAVKSILKYPSNGISGDYAFKIVYKYEDINNPTSVTTITESNSTIP